MIKADSTFKDKPKNDYTKPVKLAFSVSHCCPLYDLFMPSITFYVDGKKIILSLFTIILLPR